MQEQGNDPFPMQVSSRFFLLLPAAPAPCSSCLRNLWIQLFATQRKQLHSHRSTGGSHGLQVYRAP